MRGEVLTCQLASSKLKSESMSIRRDREAPPGPGPQPGAELTVNPLSILAGGSFEALQKRRRPEHCLAGSPPVVRLALWTRTTLLIKAIESCTVIPKRLPKRS